MMANGNRFSTSFRVAYSPTGHRRGDLVTKSTARSSSATKLRAAVSLRSKYQVSAALNSASAAGWISSILAAIEDGRDLTASFRPGNRFHFARIQFRDPACDLFAPFFLYSLVHSVIKAFEEAIGQCGPRFGRKSECLFQKVGNVWAHGAILSPKHFPCSRKSSGASGRIGMGTKSAEVVSLVGGGGRTRTCDLRIMRRPTDSDSKQVQ